MNWGDAGDHNDRRTYLARFTEGHFWDVSVELQNKDGDTLVSFDEGRGGGRTVAVTDGDVTTTPSGRMLRLTVTDPDKLLLVGQDANFTDRQLHVRVGVPVPKLGREVWVPPFTGPIASGPRTGDTIQFTAYGREFYAKHGIPKKYVVKKGTRITTAIKNILIDLAGESPHRLGNIPDLPQVLKADLPLGITARPWAVCTNLAQGLDRHLAYDGGGFCHMPRLDPGADPLVTFTGEPGHGDLLIVDGPPQVNVDWLQVKNAVRVTGGKGKAKRPPVGFAICNEANFPDSPFTVEKIGYRWHTVTFATMHTHLAVDHAAHRILARDLKGTRDVKWSTVPFPGFDFGDTHAVGTEEIDVTDIHRGNVLPLQATTGGAQTMGFWQRIAADASARRRAA